MTRISFEMHSPETHYVRKMIVEYALIKAMIIGDMIKKNDIDTNSCVFEINVVHNITRVYGVNSRKVCNIFFHHIEQSLDKIWIKDLIRYE